MKISDSILNAVASAVPKIHPLNNTSRYLNRKIKKLQKHKSYLISLLHRLNIRDPLSRLAITASARVTLAGANKALHTEVKKLTERSWVNALKKNRLQETRLFVPRIKALLSPKQFDGVKDLHVRSDNPILVRSVCDLDNVQKTGNQYIHGPPPDKINIIGSYFETINSPQYLNDGTRLKQIVDREAGAIKAEFTESREQDHALVQINNENKSSSPATLDIPLHPFCTTEIGNTILRCLPNKTSSGLDGIPTIVLKHLPPLYNNRPNCIV